MNGSSFADFIFAFIEDGVEVGDNFLGLGDKVDEAAVQDDSSSPENTFLTYAVSKGLIQTTAYSVSFDDPLETLPTGNILLGGLDAGKINGSLETLDTTIVRGTNTFYDTVLAVPLESVSYSPGGDLSHQKAIQPFQAIQVHPSSGPMSLPVDIATTIWAALGATYDTTIDPPDAVPVVPCSYLTNTTTLDLHFSSTTIIQIPMSDITVHNGTGINGEDGTYAEGCKLDIGAIYTNESFNSIGVMALKHMYTVFDLQNNEISIGLRSTSNKASSNIMAIGQAGVPALNLGASSPTPTPTPSPSHSSTPKKSHRALAIGLGVGLSLGIILLVGIIVGAILFFRRKRATPAPTQDTAPNPARSPVQAPFHPSSPQPDYSQYPEVAVIPEKPPGSDDGLSPARSQGPQHISPTSEQDTTAHELPGSTIRHSELSGISTFQIPRSPEQNHS